MAGRCGCASSTVTGVALTGAGGISATGSGSPSTPFLVQPSADFTFVETVQTDVRPNGPAIGQLVYDPGHNMVYQWTGAKWDPINGGTPSARVFTDGSQTIPNLTAFTIDFQLESYKQPASVHAPSGAYLIADRTGVWEVSAVVDFARNPTGVRAVQIMANHTGRVATASRLAMPYDADIISVSGLWRAGTNDYFEVQAFQDSGVALSFNSQFAFHFLGGPT